MLTPRERAVLETLLPAGGHPALKGLFEAGFEDFYRDFERTAIMRLRLGFKAALFAAIWISPLLIGRLPPLTRLERENREAALEALGRSRFYVLRQLFLVLKTVSCFCYGADPQVRRAIGFPGP